MEKSSDRRRFLKNGAMLAGMAVGAARAAGGETLEAEATEIHPKDLHAYGERSRFETSIRTGSLGTWPQLASPPDYHKDFGFRTPLQDSIGILTPPALHYIVSHGYEPPDIDPLDHRLLIHGGGPSVNFHVGRFEAIAFRDANPFRGMQWQQRSDRPYGCHPQGT